MSEISSQGPDLGKKKIIIIIMYYFGFYDYFFVFSDFYFIFLVEVGFLIQ